MEEKDYELAEESTRKFFRAIPIEILKHYPIPIDYGFFEEKFGSDSKDVLFQLKENGLVLFGTHDSVNYCNLTKKGVEFAVALIQLEDIIKTKLFSERLMWFTKILVVLGIGTFIFAFIQILISLGF